MQGGEAKGAVAVVHVGIEFKQDLCRVQMAIQCALSMGDGLVSSMVNGIIRIDVVWISHADVLHTI